ncbi:uncharacterized protein LOC135102272 [Scylla paramamosain]|uniref:uncharacterized protein LOC135102272 n=1 Tax=Scylla paramamosain TaxID=85552 RepID=UPI00308355EB
MESENLLGIDMFVKCSYCYKTFTTASQKRWHEENSHGTDLGLMSEARSENTGSMDTSVILGATCKICGKAFSNFRNKIKHMKNVHKIINSSVPDITCDICGKPFSKMSNKRRHVKQIHQLPKIPHKKPTLVMCKECDVRFGTLRSYRQHLLEAHNVNTKRVDYEFASEEEFLKWKDELGDNYTARSGAWKSADGFKTIYYCRRSGVNKSTRGADDKCAQKSHGKIGSFCTSSIEVVKSDGCIKVTYYMDHWGHDTDIPSLVHMEHSTSEKDKITDSVCVLAGSTTSTASIKPGKDTDEEVLVKEELCVLENYVADVNTPTEDACAYTVHYVPHVQGKPSQNLQNIENSKNHNSTEKNGSNRSLTLEIIEELREMKEFMREMNDSFKTIEMVTEDIARTLMGIAAPCNGIR